MGSGWGCGVGLSAFHIQQVELVLLFWVDMAV